MFADDISPFDPSVRLIFRQHDVSNFCKAFLYLKGKVDNNDVIRNQLENGYNHWEYEGGMEQTFSFIPDWFDIDRKNKLPKHLIVKEFCKFLQFHVESTFRNNYFSVVKYPLMGLGVKNKNRIEIDAFGDECPGYLEFIDVDLFDALHALGYNSLFTYVDTKQEKQYCILYGPLSLCNSDKKRDVGFSWLNQEGDEFLYENRFTELQLKEVLFPNSPDEMEVTECSVKFSQRVFHYTCEKFYNYCKYIKHSDCAHPVVSGNSKIELLVGIQLEYAGLLTNPQRGSPFFEAGEQVFVSYDWANPRGWA